VADAPVQTLLIFDNATVVLKMRRSGKFYAKASGWETNRTVLEGQKIEIWVDNVTGSSGELPARSISCRRCR
jgi:hypothetical protein